MTKPRMHPAPAFSVGDKVRDYSTREQRYEVVEVGPDSAGHPVYAVRHEGSGTVYPGISEIYLVRDGFGK